MYLLHWNMSNQVKTWKCAYSTPEYFHAKAENRYALFACDWCMFWSANKILLILWYLEVFNLCKNIAWFSSDLQHKLRLYVRSGLAEIWLECFVITPRPTTRYLLLQDNSQEGLHQTGNWPVTMAINSFVSCRIHGCHIWTSKRRSFPIWYPDGCMLSVW